LWSLASFQKRIDRRGFAAATRLRPAIIGHTTLMPNSVPGGIPYDMRKFSAMLPTPDTSGDFEEMCMPAGEGVRVIKNLQPAAEIVVEMMEGARLALEEQVRRSAAL
jgi:hypothetical protein